MYMKYPVETIVTSFLFLSRVWSRHTDVVCDGGRGEGDKWFDGCRWCVCQRSGPLCSPSECSDLVNQVPPCNKVGSRWRDGCYHCKCHRHGIECAADRTCVLYMNSEQYSKDFLSLGACVRPKDDRCVCGIDGVPSCTAEVIDRNAYPATTIGLEAAFPSSPSLVAPRNVYYDRSYRNFEKRHAGTHDPEYYSDSSDFRGSVHSKHYRDYRRSRRHSLAKRHAYRPERHSRDFYDTRRFQDSDAYDDFAALLSHRDSDNVYRKHNRDRRRFETEGPSARELRQERRYERRELRERSRDHSEDGWEDGFFGDEPSRESTDHIPPSLLVTSDNRCRWGVRWYGGGLRCYCDQETSITCGDPSFVASRIDGFRLERAPCEEGHVWEDEDTCRVCECQMSGMALCRRSSSCPLPFLIAPLSMDTDDEYYFDRKGFDGSGKGRGAGEQTDEFTGEEGRKIDWDKAGDRRNRMGYDETDGTDKDAGDVKNGKHHIKEEHGDSNKGGDTQGTKHRGHDERTTTDTDVVDLDLESTDKPNVVIDTKEEPGDGTGGKVDSKINGADKEGYDEDDVGGDNNAAESVTKGEAEVEDSDIKRTTIVTVRECKPHSRWLDGCKRCQCNYRGQKDCDDSRCLKAEVVTVETSNASVDGSGSRPIQRPPPSSSLSVLRDHPVTFELPFNLNAPCGRFHVGQVYWKQCNLCRCTPHGPKCTARNCT